MSMSHRGLFAALVIASGGLAGVSEPRPAILHTPEVFANLLSCEIPGLREHVVGRGPHTVAFAGEFSHVSIAQLRTSAARIYLYVVSGTGVVRIGDTTTQAHPGDFFVIPTNAPHAVSSSGGTMRTIFFEDRS